MTRPIFPQLPYIRPQLPSASTSPSPIWHSGLSPYHYLLYCQQMLEDVSYVNIIVKHVVRRIVQKDPVTHSYIYSPYFSNTYYHPISDHIRRKNPLFTGSVRLSSSLCASIGAVQKQVLENSDLNIEVVGLFG